MVAAINANPVAKTRFDGVAVEVSSDGGMYKTSALLKIDPERPDQRRWLSTDVVLPAGTTGVRLLDRGCSSALSGVLG